MSHSDCFCAKSSKHFTWIKFVEEPRISGDTSKLYQLCHNSCHALLLKISHPDLFFVHFHSLQMISKIKTVDFREISCRIFGVECEHPDHFLSTTAQLYYYFLLRNSKLNLIIEMFDVLWILFQDDRISRQKKWESVGRDRAVEI